MDGEINIDSILNTGANGTGVQPAPIVPPTAPVPAEGEPNPNPTPTPAEVTATAEAARVAEEEEDKTPTNQLTGDAATDLRTTFSNFGTEEGLSEDDKEVRASLLAKFGGTTFDPQGNIIDETGKVHKSFDDLLNYVESDDEVTLDAHGNQVDAEGKVTKTALEIARETTVINQLHQESGYEFVDENGNIKIYSDDTEGAKNYTDDTATHKFEQYKAEFFDQNAELKEMAKHLLGGGTIDSFSAIVDYSDIDISKLTESEKESYVRKSFGIKGYNKARTDSFVTLIKDSATLDAEVVNALEDLEAHKETTQAGRDQAYQDTIEEDNAKMEKYWDSVEDVVIGGKLGSIAIPQADKQAFFDYLSTSVDDSGNTKEMLDREKETVEQQLTSAFYRFKGYDFSKLVESKVQLSKVKTLKERIRQSAKIKTSSTKAPSKPRGGGSEINIRNMLK